MKGEDPAKLAAIIRRLSHLLEPQPTGVEPKLSKLDGIQAVVFDVYGTLLISGSGDISLTSGVSKAGAAAEALRAVVSEPPASAGGEELVERLLATIQADHAASPHDFPEVEIRDIWRKTLAAFDAELVGEAVARLALEYECRVNPVWPMPGAAETLSGLRAAGRTLGIVSNAQFFTPIAMQELLGATMSGLGFDAPLCVWSFAHRQAKPGTFLYEKSAAALAGWGIRPEQVLYVGNDMRNDVAPAAAVGFRTALFAGDARSLRWREGDPLVEGVEPDAVVTELPQILSILSLAGG